MEYITFLSIITSIIGTGIYILLGVLLIKNSKVRKYLNIQTLDELHGNKPSETVVEIEKIISYIGILVISLAIINTLTTIFSAIMILYRMPN